MWDTGGVEMVIDLGTCPIVVTDAITAAQAAEWVARVAQEALL